MAQTTAREDKLIQYLNEAYTKEQELVTALTAHIAMTTRAPYKKRLQEHLRETKAQAKGLERRIKQLGGKADSVAAVAKKGVALAKGELQAVRGGGQAEKMLKNAKTEVFNEAEEIANYVGIETLATALGDGDTAKLAKEFRRQEERMQKFLERTIPQLTKAVVSEEIPARERKPSSNGAAPARRRTAAKTTTARAKTTASRPTARKPAARKTTARRSTARKS
jgi:ferritin-like metal-binding protein YciE